MPIVLAQPSEEFQRIAAEQAAVCRAYAALAGASVLDQEHGLGGKLLFAEDLARNPDLIRAASIAGAASLSASADPAAGRAAMRDGAIDFLVTSLDEALRILKNEVRKRQPVSVSVMTGVDEVVREMLERGVLPDLLAESVCEAGPVGEAGGRQFLDQGSLVVAGASSSDAEYVAWSVSAGGGQWLSQIDDCARAVFPAGELARERWLRLAPRYLGRTAQRQHGVLFRKEEAEQFRAEVEAWAAAGGSDDVAVTLGSA